VPPCGSTARAGEAWPAATASRRGDSPSTSRRSVVGDGGRARKTPSKHRISRVAPVGRAFLALLGCSLMVFGHGPAHPPGESRTLRCGQTSGPRRQIPEGCSGQQGHRSSRAARPPGSRWPPRPQDHEAPPPVPRAGNCKSGLRLHRNRGLDASPIRIRWGTAPHRSRRELGAAQNPGAPSAERVAPKLPRTPNSFGFSVGLGRLVRRKPQRTPIRFAAPLQPPAPALDGSRPAGRFQIWHTLALRAGHVEQFDQAGAFSPTTMRRSPGH